MHTRRSEEAKKENLKIGTDSVLIAAQHDTIRIKYIKAKIDNTQQNCKCRLRGDRDEIINHVINKLAQKEYNVRHNWVGKVTH